ncbi:methyltransferase type 11 [Streptomyces sp. NPDC048629]|uniref:methyltransferase type 11 n=1 Tax=Streptomyces sp. NPDC048629 TaxID=3154824 RepID=UPI003415B87E
MTPTLVRHDPVRDWVEIQERMLAPLYEAVYERLGVDAGTRLLGLDCGSGLALLMAAARGARVAGTDPDGTRLEQARQRLAAYDADLAGSPAAPGPYDVITAFHPTGRGTRTPGALAAAVTRSAVRGAAVVLAGWGPPERCASAPVLGLAARLSEAAADGSAGPPVPRDDLDERVARAGLRPDGSGRVACPFGYADLDSAVRGLLSTGVFDPAAAATDTSQVEKELAEALHPYVRGDGTVWMPNVFRYVIARVP